MIGGHWALGERFACKYYQSDTLIFEVGIDRTWASEHNGLLKSLFVAFILLPSAFNYWLSYRCFRRAQVITNKPTRL